MGDFQWHNVYTKFRENWSFVSKVEFGGGGHEDSMDTDFFPLRKESRLKIKETKINITNLIS